MDTTTIYKNNLKNHLILEEMIESALYSLSMRIHNYEITIRNYRAKLSDGEVDDQNGNISRCEEQKQELFEEQIEIFQHIEPTSIVRSNKETSTGNIYTICYVYLINEKTYYRYITTQINYNQKTSSSESIFFPFNTIKYSNKRIDVKELLSLQFIRKILEVLRSNNYTII